MDSIYNVRKYIANKHTLLLESKLVGKKVHTNVYDQRGTFEVKQSPPQIIRNSCKMYGSSLEASLDISKEVLQKWQKHKLPIVVGNDLGIPLVMFPIFSPKAKSNIWVMYNHITDYQGTTDGSIIQLSRQHTFNLPISKASLAIQSTSSGILQRYIQENWLNNGFIFFD